MVWTLAIKSNMCYVTEMHTSVVANEYYRKGERKWTVHSELSNFGRGIRTLPICEIKDFEWVPITLLLRNKNLHTAYAEPWRSHCSTLLG